MKFIVSPRPTPGPRLLKLFWILAFAGMTGLLFSPSLNAGVYLSQEQALGLYFPPPQIVERNTLFLSNDELAEVKKKAKAPLNENVISYYKGLQNGNPSGFAFFDTHTVRTMPETIMTVISPDGKIKGVEILSFFEPKDYEPSEKWRDQFKDKSLDDHLMVKRGIRNMAGATLTARSITESTRRALALFEFLNKVGGGEK